MNYGCQEWQNSGGLGRALFKIQGEMQTIKNPAKPTGFFKQNTIKSNKAMGK